MKLIDKADIVAEIEARRKRWLYGSSIESKYKKEECDDILSCIDTLEVKESDKIAEVYDKVREKIALRFGSNVAEEIFSEFEMSEDEKIRKEIIDYIKTGTYHKDWLTWLEKQGEQKSIDNLTQQEAMDIAVAKCFNEQKATDKIEALRTEYEKGRADVLAEAAKVEPKLHEGDWIVYEENIYQIHNVSLKKYYECLKTDGTVHTFDFEYIDSKSHIWTINDTKKGDILVCKGNVIGSNGITYERICLFNNLNEAFFTLDKFSNSVEEYGIDVNIDYPGNTVPATKEQKEILLMTMKYAGYEFDFEKKEFKKIETKFKPGDCVMVSTATGDRIVQIASVEYLKDGQPCYFTTEGRCFGNVTKARLLTNKDMETKIKPKSEDDVRRRSTIQVLEYARSLDAYNQYGKADIDKNIAWLEKL